MINKTYADYAWEKTAALLAIEMLAIEDAALAQKLQDERDKNHQTILEKNAAIEAQFNS